MLTRRSFVITALLYRQLKPDEVGRIVEIDRSETVRSIYVFDSGGIREKEVFFDITGFPEGELEEIIDRQRKILAAGGSVYGAFDGVQLVGVASVENRLRGTDRNYCKMDILHVSNAYRRRGIAIRLMEMCKEKAREFGAFKLYISATESKNTVEFYLKRGARLTEELDPELYSLEPDDIHLELDLE